MSWQSLGAFALSGNLSDIMKPGGVFLQNPFYKLALVPAAAQEDGRLNVELFFSFTAEGGSGVSSQELEAINTAITQLQTIVAGKANSPILISDVEDLGATLSGKANTPIAIADITGLETTLEDTDTLIAAIQGTLLNKADAPIAIADVTGLQTALTGKAAATHGHIIADVAGLQTAIDNINSDLVDFGVAITNKADASHSHAIASVTGLQAAIDDLQSQISSLASGGGNPALLTYTISQSAVDAGFTGTYANLTDGSFTTGAATPNATSWIEADLGSVKSITSVAVAGGNLSGWDSNVAAYLNGAQIQISLDDTNWTSILTIGTVSNSAESEFAVPTTRCRYIRLFRGGYLGTTSFKIKGF